MATESLINPFADYGGIVYGNRFIGRVDEINAIRQRVLGSAFGNVAIMGLPRIGKSSLAWEAIMTIKESLLQENTIPIYFQVGSCKNSTSFFKQLVGLLRDELDMVCNDDRYGRVCDVAKCIKEEQDPMEICALVQKYYRLVKLLGYKVIYILDEFDSVESLFDVSDFQTLRELSYNPETKICLTTCSRRTIQEIEAKNGAISNFYGTFSDVRLGVFSDKDMMCYWRRVERSMTPTDEYKKQAEFYVGRHPFLLDLYNSYCVNNNLVDSLECPGVVIENLRLTLLQIFNTLQDTLKHENLLDKAIQLVVGPVYNVKKIEEEKLLRYNFIKVIDNEEKLGILGRLIGSSFQGKSYVCFSPYYTKVLEQQYLLDVDYWPLWSETEKLIRDLIKIYVEEVYGPDWEVAIEGALGTSQSWSDAYNMLKSTRKKTLAIFPSASHNLIDYTLTRDMYNVFINTGWKDWFCHVFGTDKKAWGKKFTFLADVRNPMAHNNKEFISDEQITNASNYCREIKAAIKDWQSSRQ